MARKFIHNASLAVMITLAFQLHSLAQADAHQPSKEQSAKGQAGDDQGQELQQGQGQTPQQSSIPNPRDESSKDSLPRSNTRKAPPPVKPEDLIFSARDQQLIRQWFLMNGTTVTLALAKRDASLPLGSEQQLKKNSVVSPMLQKRIDAFPPGLARQLSELPREYSRGILGVYALIVDRNFRIMDVMRFR